MRRATYSPRRRMPSTHTFSVPLLCSTNSCERRVSMRAIAASSINMRSAIPLPFARKNPAQTARGSKIGYKITAADCACRPLPFPTFRHLRTETLKSFYGYYCTTRQRRCKAYGGNFFGNLLTGCAPGGSRADRRRSGGSAPRPARTRKDRRPRFGADARTRRHLPRTLRTAP